MVYIYSCSNFAYFYSFRVVNLSGKGMLVQLIWKVWSVEKGVSLVRSIDFYWWEVLVHRIINFWYI